MNSIGWSLEDRTDGVDEAVKERIFRRIGIENKEKFGEFIKEEEERELERKRKVAFEEGGEGLINDGGGR